jgi:hypothetical protein
MKALFRLSVIMLFIYSCNKDDNKQEPDPINPQDKERAQQLTTFLKQNEFQLSAYYSETPIDYIDTDQVVKAETDLWQYVSLWVKDDRFIFQDNGEVLIEQNEDRIQTDTSATLTRQYGVEADKDGVGFKFVGHEYQPLNYRLITFSDTLLKVKATWNNKEVISEYRVTQ